MATKKQDEKYLPQGFDQRGLEATTSPEVGAGFDARTTMAAATTKTTAGEQRSAAEVPNLSPTLMSMLTAAATPEASSNLWQPLRSCHPSCRCWGRCSSAD